MVVAFLALQFLQCGCLRTFRIMLIQRETAAGKAVARGCGAVADGATDQGFFQSAIFQHIRREVWV